MVDNQLECPLIFQLPIPGTVVPNSANNIILHM